jgi:tripartite-type tricarboxylate transporter receptor subunit TctC
MGGSIDAMFSTTTLAAPYLRSGKLRALAVTGSERSTLHPEIPTVAEAGLPSVVSEGWYGIVAPAGVPASLKEKLHAAFVASMADPVVRQALLAAGNEPAGLGPKPFDEFIRTEVPRWAEVIKRARIEQM